MVTTTLKNSDNSVFFENPELFKLAKDYIRIEGEVCKAYSNEFNLPK